MKETKGIIPDLPEGWAWTKFEEIAKLNYRDPAIDSLPDDFMVTFLPMAAVDAEKGILAKPEKRPLVQVRKGFTPFSERCSFCQNNAQHGKWKSRYCLRFSQRKGFRFDGVSCNKS